MALQKFATQSLLFLCAALFSAHIFAHSSLTASLPGGGSEVSSPETLELTFNEPVRLLRLTLVHGPSHNIDFGFAAQTAPHESFTYNLPTLMTGEHTVTWTVIGSDGHTVTGSFGFSVNPQAGAAEMQTHSHGEHHHHHGDGGHQHH